ncbi:MAG: shikimate kinase [Candidatus Margulisiibacteriota bacterium]
MNITLIGFMGTGKSAVGQALAGQLGLRYVDADALIEETEKQSINEIFAQKGEAYFRDLETNLLKKLQSSDGCVLAAGGGMVLRAENVKMLKALGPVVLLQASPAVIYARIKNEKHRPLLKVPDPAAEIAKILEKRKTAYAQAADFAVDTSVHSVEAVAQEVIKWLKSR